MGWFRTSWKVPNLLFKAQIAIYDGGLLDNGHSRFEPKYNFFWR